MGNIISRKSPLTAATGTMVDSEAISYRACSQLTNIDWKCVDDRKDVDEKIFKRLQRGMVLCRLFAPKNPNFAFGLQYTQNVFAEMDYCVP